MSGVAGNLFRDLRQAARSLRRAPLFSSIVVITLGLGIGVNTAMFSLVDTIVLRPLPYPEPDRLVKVGIRSKGFDNGTYGIRLDELKAIRSGVEAFEEVGVYAYGGGTLTGDGGPPEEPTSLTVDPELQRVTGLRPLLGRGFADEDCAAGANPVVLLGEDIWRRRYDADPAAVGRTVLLDGLAHEIVGIAPDTYRFPDESSPIQVFRPLDLQTVERWGVVGLVARLSDDTDQRRADEQLATVAAGLAEERPDSNTDRSFYARPMLDDVVGNVRTALLLLWGAVGFVLVLACMNAANLLLARSAAKAHEIAVCSAIGASRFRVMQRVLSESVILALVAGLLGLLVAQWSIEGVAGLGLENLPRSDEVAIDGRIFAFTGLMALATGLLYGLLPAWQVSRVEIAEMIKEGGGRSSIGPSGQRIRTALTVGQVAIACVLLIGAGLMIRSSMGIRSTDPGFAYENVLGLTMWADQPPDTDSGWSIRFYDDVLQRIEAVAGVAGASMISAMPWQSLLDRSVDVAIEGHPAFAAGEPESTTLRIVTEDYLEEMRVPLLAGRYFVDRDDAEGTAAAVVSRDLAERYWPDGDGLGQILLLGSKRAPVEIVGVVGGVRDQRLDQAPEPVIYLAFRQQPSIAMTVMVRTEGKPEALERSVQEAVWAVSPTQGIWRTTSLEKLLGTSLAREQLYMMLLSIFAGVAVLLAAVGIYGVISYAVTQRTREIGIRMALGARNGEILGRVLAGGIKLSAIGLLIGLPAAYGLARGLEGLLHEIGPLDPMTYVGVSVIVLGVAALACYLPAFRATRVHPMTCLRTE